jgi:Cu(I)/Ag(I) efflux system membrane fusion protein
MKTFLIILFTALIAVVGARWFNNSQTHLHSSMVKERKPLFYQSPMHPWIKSDKPGRCTICGMKMVPIYEADKAFDSTSPDTVLLNERQIQVINVSITEAKIQPLIRHLEIAGTIDEDPTRHRILSAYVDGRINKLYLNYVGAEVEKGTPLVDLYSPTLLQAERESRQLSGELKRNTTLRLIQMGLNAEQIDALSTKSIETLSSQILAPMGGTVLKQDVFEGQYVTTGQSMFEIADFSTMWLQFIAYEQDLPSIQMGQLVTITTPALPGKSFTGKISFIDPNVDEWTRSTKVRVEISNPKVNGHRAFLLGMYADGLVETAAPSVLSVPRSAVIAAGPKSVVYVEHGHGAYRQVSVQTGIRGDDLIEIRSGLQVGDRVVTTGSLLIDGQAELDRSFEVSSVDHPPDTLNDEQLTAIRNFVKLADEMSAALGNDDLMAFNQISKEGMKTTETLIKILAPLSIFSGKLAALEKSEHFDEVADLKSAREGFYQWNLAATDLLGPMRKWHGFPDIQVWQCPMVGQAVPGAKGKGRWIQTAGRVGQNPYFGKEMQDCGDQIKP